LPWLEVAAENMYFNGRCFLPFKLDQYRLASPDDYFF
jgi:hypothetical protein